MMKMAVALSSNGVRHAIKELNDYRDSIVEKVNEMNKRLAEIGVHEAQTRFDNAQYDGDNDVVVSYEMTKEGWTLIARGEAVAFIEFGTGRTLNPNEPYPKSRPQGIVGIGEFGYGQGKNPFWRYKNENGRWRATQGNPAALAMYNAELEIINKVKQVAKEVFR